MLTFLAPLFLAGLAALAVPVIVHLIHRQRDDVVEFPSLMFVRRIPYKTTKKQKIRHWFLLAMRCLALILIAGAFARPLLNRDEFTPTNTDGALERVVLLDRSYSMGYGDTWTRARNAVEDALTQIGAEDRVTLVLFDERAEAVRGEDGDVSVVRNALQEASPGALGTRYAPALRLTQSLLQNSQRPRREVVLVTDFQRSGWSAQELVEFPEGTAIETIDVGGSDSPNHAVAGVSVTRAMYAGSERITVHARIVNRSSQPIVQLPVALELGSRRYASTTVDVEANGVANVSFEPFSLTQPNLHASVVAQPDRLAIDDRYSFVLSPGQTQPVLIARARRANAGETFYLERALEVDNTFAVTVDVAEALFGRAIPRGSVVVLNDAGVPGGNAGKRLAEHVEAGGGLLLIAGANAPRGDGGGLLPAGIGSVVDREIGRAGRVAQVSYDHALFDAFRTPRSGDFASARFYRYRELDPADDGTVLARFDDGRPSLVEKKVGRGRVLVWAAPLDNVWSDFVIQPVFLPFVHQLVTYASGRTQAGTAQRAGDVLDLSERIQAAPDRELIVAYPSGKRVTLNPGQTFLQLDEAGFYQIRATGQAAALATTVAANPDVSESDLTRMPAADLQSALQSTGAKAANTAAEELTAAEREQRQSGWWYMMVVAALFLIAESIISNRLSRVARA